MQDTPCGECEYCLGGNEHVCENKLEFGKHFPGGFAEYVLVPQVVVEKGWVRRVPEGLSYDAATLVEPLSSCVHAQHISGIGRGDNIVVIGAGPIGCMHLQLARHRGARSVTMVEISGARLSLVQAFSPDLVIDPSKGDMVESFRAVYPVGADVAIVACPSPEAVSQAVLVTRKCGRVVIFGGLPKDRAGVCLDGNYIHYEEISVMGSYAYTRAENDEALELVRTGVVRPENYITQVFCLDDVVQAFEAAKAATALKIKVVPC
jgi:L-iditol 2-dehydrogenase